MEDLHRLGGGGIVVICAVWVGGSLFYRFLHVHVEGSWIRGYLVGVVMKLRVTPLVGWHCAKKNIPGGVQSGGFLR